MAYQWRNGNGMASSGIKWRNNGENNINNGEIMATMAISVITMAAISWHQRNGINVA
jgi:hypothetical protein